MVWNKLKMVKIFRVFIIVLVIIMANSFYPKSVSAYENKVIRVGFPIKSGFSEKKDGLYTGYVYEYLREIAIYTGWEYEFVEKSFSELMNDLQDGNIDILAGVSKNEENMNLFDFPRYTLGNTYTTLSILDNSILTNSKHIILEDINIGYLEEDIEGKNNFLKFCEENEINDINLVPYSSSDGREFLLEKMKAGEVDAIIGEDLPIDTKEKIITKFGANPYYLATTKGNLKIINDLNMAIYKIKEADTSFDKDIYSKYFKNTNYSILILNKNEEDYIKNTPSIKAVYVDSYMPIQVYDENTKEDKGIFIDAMKLISEKAGISFEFVRAKTYEEAYEMIRDNKADIIIGAPNDYLIADKNDFILTKVYLKLDLVKVVNIKEENNGKKQIIASVIGHGPIDIAGEYEIKYYDSIEECLIAVNEGRATVTYGNNYSIPNYVAAGYYKNLTSIPNSGLMEVAVGVSKSMDNNLINILNKAVYTLSDDDIANIAYQNTLNIEPYISIKEFFFTNLTLCLTIIGIVLSIIFILVYIVIKMKFDKIKEDKKRLFEKTQIDSLTGIYNREACEQIVTKYLKEKNELLYYAFIIIDIDYFKQINDRFGHKIGDNLLIEFSKILKETFSSKDVISRLGGDEFIIFIKDIKEENIENIEQNIQGLCKVMNKEVRYNDATQEISLSLGVAISNKKIEFNRLYAMSDEILYEVKRNGKNGYKIKKID